MGEKGKKVVGGQQGRQTTGRGGALKRCDLRGWGSVSYHYVSFCWKMLGVVDAGGVSALGVGEFCACQAWLPVMHGGDEDEDEEQERSRR